MDLWVKNTSCFDAVLSEWFHFYSFIFFIHSFIREANALTHKQNV